MLTEGEYLFAVGDWVVLLSNPQWGVAKVTQCSRESRWPRYQIVFDDGFRMWAAGDKINGFARVEGEGDHDDRG